MSTDFLAVQQTKPTVHPFSALAGMASAILTAVKDNVSTETLEMFKLNRLGIAKDSSF